MLGGQLTLQSYIYVAGYLTSVHLASFTNYVATASPAILAGTNQLSVSETKQLLSTSARGQPPRNLQNADIKRFGVGTRLLAPFSCGQ